MIAYLEYVNVPTKVGIAIILLFIVTQAVGELLELFGKVVPECVKVRKYFKRKRDEREQVSTMLHF